MDALNGDIAIEPADPSAPDIAALIATHIARSRSYYPEESCHTYGPSEMLAEGVLLFVVRVGGQAVAIGGLKPLGAEGCEIKSMHTLKAWRGHGIGRRMVAHLIEVASARGWPAVFLETGRDEASARARAVYSKLGFQECSPFGDHVDDPLSVFMRRPVAVETRR